MKLAALAAGFLLLLGCSAYAAPVVTVQDPTNVNRNLTVNSDGSINTVCASGCTSSIGAVTIADGADVVEGAAAAAAACPSGSAKSVAGCLAQLHSDVTGPIPACAASPCVTVIGLTSNDPCTQGTKLGAPISLTASGQVITGTSAKKTYVCSIDLVSATAQNIALVEGTGTVCATNIYGLAGGTTAATGWNLAANGGLTKGSGAGTVYIGSADANGTAANVCLLLSSSGQTSGEITYVQQ